MKRTKTHAPILALLVVPSLLLAGCATSSHDASSVSSTAVSESVSAEAENSASASDKSQGQEASVQDSSGASAGQSSGSASPSASDIALDDSQVEQTQTLVQDAQSALASAQLDSSTPTAQAADENNDSSTADPVLSSQTQDEILKVATGSAADDFMATAFEYLQNGWKVEGKPTFVGSPKISTITFDGKDAKKLEVCVDSSQVNVTDEAGNKMLSSDTPKRSLTYYTLVSDNNTWKIASVDFPDNPDC